MKKIAIAAALLVATLATAGQLRHPSNSLTLDGKQITVGSQDWPVPICPPDCADR